jgi:Flp pilus assembly protein TadG
MMRDSRSCRGQNLVEFGLVLPILVAIMLAIVDLGFIFFIRGSVENGAREGARFGSVNAPTTDTSGITSRVTRTITGLDPSSLTINVTCCDDVDCSAAPDAVKCSSGNRVRVNVQYPLAMFWPIPVSGTYQTSATMRIESDAPISP